MAAFLAPRKQLTPFPDATGGSGFGIGMTVRAAPSHIPAPHHSINILHRSSAARTCCFRLAVVAAVASRPTPLAMEVEEGRRSPAMCVRAGVFVPRASCSRVCLCFEYPVSLVCVLSFSRLRIG